MGRYIEPSHVESIFGTRSVAAWTNLDNDQAADATQRLERAIAWAEDYLDDRFRGSRYQVPLQSATGQPLLQVQDWAAWLAGWWLRRARGEDQPRAQQQFDTVNRQIELVLRGLVRLPAAVHPSGSTSHPRIAR